MRKTILAVVTLILSGCVSGQITVQTDCGSMQGKSMSASHKDTDQNPATVTAPIAVGAGGSAPNSTGSTTK